MSDSERMTRLPTGEDFDAVVRLIEAARGLAIAAVNTGLIELYWQVGKHISEKIASAAWGEGVVDRLALHITTTRPELRGFTRANLFRMRQFYETYRGDDKVAPLVRQLPWTHNLLILGRSKRPEEREFYLRTAARERWSKRELERQLDGSLFERVVLTPAVLSPAARLIDGADAEVFRDSYMVEFLQLPAAHSEADFQQALLSNLKQFLLEIGGDFAFMGEQYRLQVGGRDFYVDLLFYHRGLACLVAFELKVGPFEPADLGQLQFYLEALDRDVRKPQEGPAVGVLLCASKDQEVVEYALSRTLSPAVVAEYRTRLPNKKLLQAKLQEFYDRAAATAGRTAEPTRPEGRAKRK